MAKLGTDGALDAAGCSRSGVGAPATDDAALVSVGSACTVTAGGTFSED